MSAAARIANAAVFAGMFRKHLEVAYKEHPEDYGRFIVDPVLVAERMQRALVEGTYSHTGRAMKATCVELGIKHTYSAIEDYLNGIEVTRVAVRGSTATITKG